MVAFLCHIGVDRLTSQKHRRRFSQSQPGELLCSTSLMLTGFNPSLVFFQIKLPI